jgi:hypothetical protein
MDIENVVYIPNRVIYLVIKDNEIMFAGKWMELKIIMLCNISQVKKENSVFFIHLQNIDLK